MSMLGSFSLSFRDRHISDIHFFAYLEKEQLFVFGQNKSRGMVKPFSGLPFRFYQSVDVSEEEYRFKDLKRQQDDDISKNYAYHPSC